MVTAAFGMVAGAEPPRSPSDSPICIKRLDDAAIALEQLAAEVNETWDVEALNFRLGYDESELITFVRESIHFEPYTGTLKGVTGTLSARSGNALDQAMLLASLLKDAGMEARIARARLGAGDAERLARAALHTREPVMPVTDRDAAERKLAKLAELTGREIPDLERGPGEHAIDPSVTDLATRLEALLEPADGSGTLAEPLSDYFWVQWRVGPGDQWHAAHPAFGRRPAPEALEAKAYFGDQIPQSLQHRIRFEIGIERLRGGALETQWIASPWERPVANVFGEAITVGLLPLVGATPDPGDAATPSIFVPMFNGRLAPGGRAFSLLGQVVDPGVAGSSAAGVFETVGQRFLEAAQSVVDDPENKPLMVLTGQFIRVTWIRPGGRKRTEERWLLDRLANRMEPEQTPVLQEGMNEQAVSEALFYQRTYLVQPPGEHLAWTLKRSIEGTASRLRWSAAMLRGLDWETGDFTIEPGRIPEPDRHAPLLLKLSALAHHPIELGNDRTTWRHGPFVAALHLPLSVEPALPWLDIHLNPWRGLRLDRDQLLDWPQGAMLRGVLDTAWEASVAGVGNGYVAVTGERLRRLETPRLSSQRRDIGQGFVLAEIAPGDGGPRWWRINPGTGEVLGMQPRGGAAELTDYLGALTVGLTAFLITRSLIKCGGMASPLSKACCSALAVLFGISGGAGVGAAFVSAPIAMTLGAALGVTILEIQAMVVIDYTQSLATDAVCGDV